MVNPIKKHVYTLIAVAVFAGPLALSFDSKVHFWTHWPATLGALALTGVLFLFWDAVAVLRGDWKFPEKWTGRWRFLGLPLGELLFFVAVPYACLFVFEVLRTYVPSTVLIGVPASFLYSGALVFVLAAWIFRRHGYTVLALASVTVFLTTLALTRPSLAGDSTFLWWLAVCFVAFVIVNGIYTALPTIRYNETAIWGLRIGTIPLEDFFYNLGYLGLTLCFYLSLDAWLPALGVS